MHNYLIELCFDGTNYHGWQVQQNANTVQAELCRGAQLLFREKTDVSGCSRTDSGVHARQYYCTMRTERDFSMYKLADALNANLPEDISVLSCVEMPLSFHPRYDALGKEYVYRIWNSRFRNPFENKYSLQYYYPLDVEMLNEAARSFEGKQDFAAFMSAGGKIEDTVRSIWHCRFERQGNLVVLRIAADGFLYNMVRIIAGTLLKVGVGKMKPEDMPGLIASRKREKAGPTAPAHALALNRVFYPSLGKEE